MLESVAIFLPETVRLQRIKQPIFGRVWLCDIRDRHAQTRSGLGTEFTASVVQWSKNSYTRFRVSTCNTALKLYAIKNKIRPLRKVGPFLKSTHI